MGRASMTIRCREWRVCDKHRAGRGRPGLDVSGKSDVSPGRALLCALALWVTSHPPRPRHRPIASSICNAGGSRSIGHDVNNAGQVAGTVTIVGEPDHSRAVMWSGTTPVELGALPGADSSAHAINNVGQIVGATFVGVGTHATLWNGTTPTDLGTRGGTRSTANGINDAGHIVGSSSMPGDFETFAVRWTSGFPELLGSLGSTRDTEAADINNFGYIVGSAGTIDRGTHAVVWVNDGQVAIDLGTLGGRESGASAINDRFEIVGVSETASGTRHATYWNFVSPPVDLGTLGGEFSGAGDINAKGQIVGDSLTADGARHAALWEGTTIVDLNSVLDAATVSAGWELANAFGITDVAGPRCGRDGACAKAARSWLAPSVSREGSAGDRAPSLQRTERPWRERLAREWLGPVNAVPACPSAPGPKA
jgi:probable HAF family extracellular repeat protein